MANEYRESSSIDMTDQLEDHRVLTEPEWVAMGVYASAYASVYALQVAHFDHGMGVLLDAAEARQLALAILNYVDEHELSKKGDT